MVEVTDQMNAMLKYIERYQREMAPYEKRERERIAKEVEDEGGAPKGGFGSHPENIMPRGKKINSEGHLEGDGVCDREVQMIKPDLEDYGEGMTVGDYLDERVGNTELRIKREEMKEKKREVGIDGLEKPDADDLDMLLIDD